MSLSSQLMVILTTGLAIILGCGPLKVVAFALSPFQPPFARNSQPQQVELSRKQSSPPWNFPPFRTSQQSTTRKWAKPTTTTSESSSSLSVAASPTSSAALNFCALGWTLAGAAILQDVSASQAALVGAPPDIVVGLNDDAATTAVAVQLATSTTSFAGTASYLPLEIAALAILALVPLDSRTTQRLTIGLGLTNISLALAHLVGCGLFGLEFLPGTAVLVALCSLTMVASYLRATQEEVFFEESQSDWIADVWEDFQNSSSVTKFVQAPVGLSKFYRVGLLSTYIIAGAFVFSPVSPVAYNDVEPLAQSLLRRDFGLASLFLFAPVTMVLLAASESQTLGKNIAVRILNIATGISVGILDYNVLEGQNDSRAAMEAQANSMDLNEVANAVDNAFRFETNTAVALCLSFSIVAIYTLQGLLPQKQQEEA